MNDLTIKQCDGYLEIQTEISPHILAEDENVFVTDLNILQVYKCTPIKRGVYRAVEDLTRESDISLGYYGKVMERPEVTAAREEAQRRLLYDD